MKKHPLPCAALAGFCVALLSGGVVHLLATTSSSYKSGWTSALAVLVIGSVAGTYGLLDGRKPAPSRERWQYALIGGLCCAFMGLFTFVITARAWKGYIAPPHDGFFYQLTHPWVLGDLSQTGRGGHATAHGWLSSVLIGLFAGTWLTHYAFRYFDEP